MPAQFWLFLAALSGGLAVVAGAVGAHLLSDTASLDGPCSRLDRTAQNNHAIHSVALLATGILMLYSRGHGAGLLRVGAASRCRCVHNRHCAVFRRHLCACGGRLRFHKVVPAGVCSLLQAGRRLPSARWASARVRPENCEAVFR